jgi:branched-chain amino acid transport system substrate-binding protein
MSLPAVAPPSARLDDVGKAVALAFEERGRDVGRHRVELVARESNLGLDYGWEAGRVTANAREATRDDTAVAYIGEIASGASAISAPLTNRVGMLQLVPAGGYLGLTRPGGDRGEPEVYQPSKRRTLVRIWPGDHLEASAMVRWMRELRTRRLVVVDDGETLDRGVAGLIAQEMRDKGAQVKRLRFRVRRLATIRDAAAEAAAFRADTMVFTGVWQNRAAALWNRMHRAVPSMRLLGSQYVAEDAFTRDLLRGARARTYLTRPELPLTELSESTRAFTERFAQRHGRSPHPHAVYGYEAATVVLEAIAGAPRGSPALIRQHLLDAVLSRRERRGVPGGLHSVDTYGDITRARFGGYRVDERGRTKFVRVLVGGNG